MSRWLSEVTGQNFDLESEDVPFSQQILLILCFFHFPVRNQNSKGDQEVRYHNELNTQSPNVSDSFLLDSGTQNQNTFCRRRPFEEPASLANVNSGMSLKLKFQLYLLNGRKSVCRATCLLLSPLTVRRRNLSTPSKEWHMNKVVRRSDYSKTFGRFL